MSDTRLAMREFRFLDEKRKLSPLSSGEEQRWRELRQLLGIEESAEPPAGVSPPPDPYAQQPLGYYAADGNWYPLPPGYQPPGVVPEGPAGQPYPDPYAQQPYDPRAPYLYPSYPEGYAPPPAFSRTQTNPEPYAPYPSPGYYPPQPEPQLYPPAGYTPPSEYGDYGYGPAETGPAAPPQALEPVQPIESPFQELPPIQPLPSFNESLATPPNEQGQQPAAELLGLVEKPPVHTADDEVAEIDPSEVTLVESERVSEHVSPLFRGDGLPPLGRGETFRIPQAPPRELTKPPEPAPARSSPSAKLETPSPSPIPALELQPAESPMIELSESDAVAPGEGPTAIEEPADSAPSITAPVFPEELPTPPSMPAPAFPEELPKPPSMTAPVFPELPEPPSMAAPVLPEVLPEPPPMAAPAFADLLPAIEPELGPLPETESAQPNAPLPDQPAAPPVLLSPATADVLQQRESPAVPKEGPVTKRPPLRVEGEHRVIVHTIEGHVRRGTVRDLDLHAPVIPLEIQSELAPEEIPVGRIKAIFFMAHGSTRPLPDDAKKIRVILSDGRQLAGFSSDFQEPKSGFFLVPADSRTNTARVYLSRASVQSISED